MVKHERDQKWKWCSSTIRGCFYSWYWGEGNADFRKRKVSLSIILLYKLCYLFCNIFPMRIYSSLLGIPSMIEDVRSLNLISFKKQQCFTLLIHKNHLALNIYAWVDSAILHKYSCIILYTNCNFFPSSWRTKVF